MTTVIATNESQIKELLTKHVCPFSGKPLHVIQTSCGFIGKSDHGYITQAFPSVGHLEFWLQYRNGNRPEVVSVHETTGAVEGDYQDICKMENKQHLQPKPE